MFKFDYIYSSPFLRTLRTAELVNESLKLPYIIPDIRIGETFFGIFDNRPNQEADEDMKTHINKMSKGDFLIV